MQFFRMPKEKTLKNTSAYISLKIVAYILSSITCIIGFIHLFSHFFAGLFIILSGLSIAPFIYSYIKSKLPENIIQYYKKRFVAIAACVVFFTSILIAAGSSDTARAQHTTQESETSIPHVDTVKAETQELEKKLAQEQEEKEKLKQELELKEQLLRDMLNKATSVNDQYNTDTPEIGKQSMQDAIEANKNIAILGNSTKDVKLFDVLSVIDGDTIKVSELGTLRLIGIDTPETKDPRTSVQCFGEEASNRAQELLDGKKVYLEFDPANRIDVYGRTLAYVFREDGYFFNQEMIKDGYAFSYKKYPHPRLSDFNQAENEARNLEKGLYSSNTCNGEKKVKTVTPPPEPKETKQTQPSTQTPPPKTTPTTKATQTTTIDTEPTTQTGYVAGTCKSLKERGYGSHFRPGDPNYTSARDKDGDGVACEN